MFACTTDEYDRLYAPWLDGAGKMLAAAGYVPGMSLLDLCGGTGAVSKAALAIGASPADIYLLDLNPRFDGVHAMQGDANELLSSFAPNSFDVIVCRQSMGYLTPGPVIAGAHNVLKRGGRFVFNSFGKPKRFGFRFKDHKDDTYLEAHAFLFGRVFHMQAVVDGSLPDFSMFEYHTPQNLANSCYAAFGQRVTVEHKNNSYLWVCKK